MARILIIDDDPAEVRLLSTALQQVGHTVTSAGDGPTGIQAALRDRPDAIVLDILMPDMDGIEVCTQIRQQPDLYEVPVLVISAVEEQEHVADAFAAGATEFLGKPFKPGAIVERIQRLQAGTTQRK